jgi:hypothetical protein
MKFLAKFFLRFNQSVFSFFSGICVSLSLNIFTSILMDSSKCFSILNLSSIGLMLVGSGVLILESVLIQNYTEKITNAKKIRMSIEQICGSPKICTIILKLTIYLLIAIVLIIASLFSLCFDFL